MDTNLPAFRGPETILLVEDDAALRRLMCRVLQRHGYTVLEASTAEVGMVLEDQYAGTIDLLVSDVVLPGLNGPRLAQRLVPRRPRVRVLFISGCVSVAMNDRLLSANASVLRKPFTHGDLVLAVRRRLDRVAVRVPLREEDAWRDR